MGATEQMPLLFAGADLFIYPHFDNFTKKIDIPYVIVEAMASGLPIVATSAGSTPEVIQHKENGLLIEPKNPAQLAKAVIQLLKEPKQAQNLKKQAKQRVQQQYDINVTVKNLDNYYRQFLYETTEL